MSNIKSHFLPKSVQNRKNLSIKSGDTVRVNMKIQEKGKTRIQTFEGLVLAVKHGKENGGTFTVRKISQGIGVERIFPLYSPNIDSIEVVRRSKVRQSKLYFLRDVVSKKLRHKLRRIVDIGTSTKDLPDWTDEEHKEDIVPEVEMLEEKESEKPEEAKKEEPDIIPSDVPKTTQKETLTTTKKKKTAES